MVNDDVHVPRPGEIYRWIANGQFTMLLVVRVDSDIGIERVHYVVLTYNGISGVINRSRRIWNMWMRDGWFKRLSADYPRVEHV